MATKNKNNNDNNRGKLVRNGALIGLGAGALLGGAAFRPMLKQALKEKGKRREFVGVLRNAMQQNGLKGRTHRKKITNLTVGMGAAQNGIGGGILGAGAGALGGLGYSYVKPSGKKKGYMRKNSKKK